MLLGAILLSGCTVSYIDTDGQRHVLGPALVSCTSSEQSPADCSDAPQGPIRGAVQITSLGFVWHRGLGGDLIGLGFSRYRDANLHTSRLQDIAAPPDSQSLTRNLTLSLYSRLPHAGKTSSNGDAYTAEVFGISYSGNFENSALAFGYLSSGFASVGDNVYIAGNPLTRLDRIFSRSTERQALPNTVSTSPKKKEPEK